MIYAIRLMRNNKMSAHIECPHFIMLSDYDISQSLILIRGFLVSLYGAAGSKRTFTRGGTPRCAVTRRAAAQGCCWPAASLLLELKHVSAGGPVLHPSPPHRPPIAPPSPAAPAEAQRE